MADKKLSTDELLDELASLAMYWKDWREEGKVPRGIRGGMLDIIKEIAEAESPPPETALEQEPGPKPGTNTGHGHVWPRPDGMRARCGGPGMCPDCSRDKARLSLNREVTP